MIEFQLSQQDREILDYVHSEALVVRKYAREWDDRESEVPPSELPEAKEYPGVERLVAKRKHDGDTSRAVLEMLMTSERSWGDYSVAIRRGRSGLGNSALMGAGTPEQFRRYMESELARWSAVVNTAGLRK